MLLRCTNALRPMPRCRSYSAGSKLVTLSVNEDTEVTTVSLNRPPVNALSLELMTEICNTVDHLEKQNSAGMILTSTLPTVFSAGLQLTEMYKPDPVRLRAFWTALQDMWTRLYSASFSTVAVVNGHSPAGGCLMSICCDYRVMVQSPKFTIGLNETRVGLPIPQWVANTMEAVIGKRQAEYALTASRLFLADQALSIGLIDEVAKDKSDGLQKAEAWLQQMSQVPPIARKLTKLSLRGDALAWMKANKAMDLDRFAVWIQTPDFQNHLGTYLDSIKKNK